jgi:hypothetical protein
MFMLTLAIPDNAFHGLSSAFTAQLTQRYAERDKKLFQYTMAASNQYLLLRDTDNRDSVLFLTDGTISDQYAEFRQTWFVKDFEEPDRYHSPELTIDQGSDRRAVISYGELINKIELNKAFRDELKYQLRTLKWSQLTAFKFNFGYIPAHYIARITPLRFVDVPKIRTITMFGERVVLENSAYVHTTSNARIFVYEKIIALLEVRLRYYEELAKEFSETDAAETRVISLPPWYSEDYADYWDAAGLPRVISGTFFSPGRGPMRQIPAILSFVEPSAESGLFGWYLAIGEAGGTGQSVSAAIPDNHFSIFIDPLKSPLTIYSRNGKTPGEKKVRLTCEISLNPSANSPIEEEVINRILKPFLDNDEENTESIKVWISFDGHAFEIRQHPAQHGNSLIFRGVVDG